MGWQGACKFQIGHKNLKSEGGGSRYICIYKADLESQLTCVERDSEKQRNGWGVGGQEGDHRFVLNHPQTPVKTTERPICSTNPMWKSS